MFYLFMLPELFWHINKLGSINGTGNKYGLYFMLKDSSKDDEEEQDNVSIYLSIMFSINSNRHLDQLVILKLLVWLLQESYIKYDMSNSS